MRPPIGTLTLSFLVATVGGLPATVRAERSSAVQAAKAHFKKGAACYKAGDADCAIAEYDASYRAKPLPAVLFNLGQAWRLKGDARRAVEYYRRYLEAEPEGPASDEAREHIAALSRELSAPKTSPPPPAAPEPVPVAPPSPQAPLAPPAASPSTMEHRRGWLTAPLIFAVGAVVMTAGGIGLYFSAKNDHDRWAAGPDKCIPSCAPDAVKNAQSREVAGYALMGLGGALAIVDVILWGVLSRRAGDQRAFWISPTLNGVLIRGEF